MKELLKALEKRREDYLELIEYKMHQYSRDEVLEIQGAIKELDVVLETIKYKIECSRELALQPEQVLPTRPDMLTKISMLFK